MNKVFGIGLSRTGTMSLNSALEILGYRSVHLPNDEQTLHELMECKYNLSVMEAFDAATDTTVVPFYPQLDAAFPESKFILTVREMSTWLDSCSQHWPCFGWDYQEPTLYDFDFYKYINACVYGCYVFNPQRFAYVYKTHTANVLHYFADRPHDLLVMDICTGDGWDKLCPFLDKPVPDQPFPHENKRPQKVTLI